LLLDCVGISGLASSARESSILSFSTLFSKPSFDPSRITDSAVSSRLYLAPTMSENHDAHMADEKDHSNDAGEKRTVKDLKQLPVRAYLDETVVPLLLKGMSQLVKERPDDPIEWLAQYLLKNKGPN